MSVCCVCCTSCSSVECKHPTTGWGNDTFPPRQNSAGQGDELFSQSLHCTSPLSCYY